MSTEEEEINFQLGDRVYIAATGPLDGLRGRIYYLDETLLRILPDGTFHRLEDIPILDGDFDPALEITNAYLLKKRAEPAFVVQHDFQVGYLAETIKENGEMGVTYKIKSIDEGADSVVLEDPTGADKEVVFGFIGIRQDEDFIIIRVRQPPDSIAENNAAEAPAAADPLTEEERGGLEILDSLDVPEIMEIREISATQRFYPDIVQRNDMLQDLLSALSIKQQKNPQRQSEIRKLVETMILLRNQFITYTRSGEPSGHINTFYTTLNELLEKGEVPLSRRVADAKRVLYLDHTTQHINGTETDPLDTAYTGVSVQYLSDVVAASVEYYEKELGGIQGQAVGGALPNWFLSWEGFFSTYQKSWVSGGTGRRPFSADTEFFRSMPEMGAVKNIDGLSNLEDNEQAGIDLITVADIKKINISLLRGVGPRVGRMREKEAPRIVESAESVAVESYLLFPLKYDRELGAIRSGKLALDIGRALTPSMTMEMILWKQPISDIPTADAIFNVSRTSFGNITVEDWLVGQPLESKGMGDVLNKLASFGLATKELNLDQMLVIIEKINKYRALVRTTIQNINEKSKIELEGISLQNNPLLLPEIVQERVNQLLGEPSFQKAIQEFQTRYPSYRENDIALFAYLFTKMYDFTVAVLSGAPIPLQREIRRKARVDFLRRLTESAIILDNKSRRVPYISEKPTVPRSNVKDYVDADVRSVNPCAHVSSITMIRKIKDNTLRMKALLEFLTRFAGEKKDNWVHCKVCSKQAICVHERLLLQEFLKPLEKDDLHKELLLTFSRSQFHGQFCCSNCGQSISDIDYDTSLEYDDEGRPMSGRAVLVDSDAILQDQFDQALGAPVGTAEDMKFPTDIQTDIYKIAKTITGRVGVRITEEGYRKISQRVEIDVAKQPSREDYSKYQKGQKAKGVATIDYDVLRSRVIIASTTAYLLVELQSGIPSYTTRYRLPGCSKIGFSGFPTGPKEQTTGIDYLACAISGISENAAPWNLTGFLKEKSVQKRQAEIAKLVMTAVNNTLKNSDVQNDMALKKEYMEKIGKVVQEEGLVEKIPSGFVPEQIVRGDSASAVPSAANDKEKGRGWILLANDIAKQTIALGTNSPYSETTCCFHPLQTPTAFWDSKDLPALPTAKGSTGGKGSHLAVHYTTRRLDQVNVVAPDSILYRVFLQVCFEGPRRGLPHEPGYDHLCPHCGFQFPRSNEILTPEEGLTALQTQKVDTSRAKFQELLDESHNRYSVTPATTVDLITGINLLTKLRALEPPPFEGWAEVISNTILAVETFSKDKAPEDTDIASAYGPLSNLAEEFKQELISRIGPENTRIAEQLVTQSPTSLVQSLQTYFLVPFQRLHSKFHTESLKVQNNYELGEGTEEDIHALLRNHLAYLDELKKLMDGITKSKVEQVRNKLMVCIPFIQEYIRTPLLPGGAIGLPYLLQAMVLGIFAECANPNLIPKGTRKGDTLDARGAMKVLSICLGRFRLEGLNFTQDEIRSMIARREEVEKMRIISKFDRMTPEQKAAELMNKRLGLGQWAVGGTDAVWKYNSAQYERERVERGEMVGLMDGAPAADEVGREAGYSNEQTGEDDH
jgi:hypothetical protein